MFILLHYQAANIAKYAYYVKTFFINFSLCQRFLTRSNIQKTPLPRCINSVRKACLSSPWVNPHAV